MPTAPRDRQAANKGAKNASTSAQSTPAKARKPRKRIASGPPRPEYLGGKDVDRLAIMMIAMLSELLSLRERVETHEKLLERDGTLSTEAIEAYRPSGDDEDQREEKRLAILRRVFRVLNDEFVHYDLEEDVA